jgi:hypothetical protein
MELYKPIKSSRKEKKYMVKVKGNKIIHFGQAGAKDFKSGKATKEDRKAYRARASKILLKNGKPAYKNKDTPAYWSYHFLW